MLGNLSLLVNELPQTDSRELVGFFLNHGAQRTLSPGTELCRQGESADHVYFLISGEVEILKLDMQGGMIPVATQGAGALVGEMGLFLNKKRSATICTLTTTRLVQMGNATFLAALHHFPALSLRLLQAQAQTIDTMNERLTQVQDHFLHWAIGALSLSHRFIHPNEPLILDLNTLAQRFNCQIDNLVQVIREMDAAGLLTQLPTKTNTEIIVIPIVSVIITWMKNAAQNNTPSSSI